MVKVCVDIFQQGNCFAIKHESLQWYNWHALFVGMKEKKCITGEGNLRLLSSHPGNWVSKSRVKALLSPLDEKKLDWPCTLREKGKNNRVIVIGSVLISFFPLSILLPSWQANLLSMHVLHTSSKINSGEGNFLVCVCYMCMCVNSLFALVVLPFGPFRRENIST